MVFASVQLNCTFVNRRPQALLICFARAGEPQQLEGPSTETTPAVRLSDLLCEYDRLRPMAELLQANEAAKKEVRE